MTSEAQSQSSFSVPLGPQPVQDVRQWHVSVSSEWDVLGPFPIHAREQHFLSPSYPLDLKFPLDFNGSFTSAYADDGEVTWTKSQSNNSRLTVAFPNIRWASLRSTEGWAALQHHTVLHTTVTVFPPSVVGPGAVGPPLVRLFIDVQQGSFFTVMPSARADASYLPKWYAGNIYAMTASPAQAVELPITPSTETPTTYDFFISGDYEIRLFGDPTVRHSDVPELLVDFSVGIEEIAEELELQPSHNVVPDFVDGWAFGRAVGVALRSKGGWWTITNATLAEGKSDAISISLLQPTRLAPTQTRIVPVLLTQESPLEENEIRIVLRAVSDSVPTDIAVTLSVKHQSLWDENRFDPIVSSYFYGTSTPTGFVTIPPKLPNAKTPQPPLLDLHGAGVNVLGHIVWDCAPPRQSRSWIIAPTGRTAWGLDWHGPSTQDAWSSVEALSDILNQNGVYDQWGFPKNTGVILVGHSNGGQGTWHMASRYPDRVIAAVPAAAYIKSQSYVPLIQSRSAHFVDPALRAILETSLTADDNDLFLTNLVDTPILAIHGGDDENVPVWHTRALVDTLKTWNRDANVTFQEDPKQPHCYPTVFDNNRVQTFIDQAIMEASNVNHQPWHFTLTVSIPAESNSLHGWRITQLMVPGRLGKLIVEDRGYSVHVSSHNVQSFSISASVFRSRQMKLVVDEQIIPCHATDDGLILVKKRSRPWEAQEFPVLQRTGRMSLILNSTGPLLLVIPQRSHAGYLNIALRLAHNLNVYHKLDSVIVDGEEAITMLHDGNLADRNIVAIGGTDNAFSLSMLLRGRTPFEWRRNALYLKGHDTLRLADEAAALFLHPHPTSPNALALFLFAQDEAHIERALRLFPIRTGVTVPDWIVLGPDTDSMGAGGVLAAGVWGPNWAWNEGMSSF